MFASLDPVLAAAKANPGVALLAVFALAFGESLAFVSLVFPATVALVGFGAVIGAGHLPFWPIWFAAFAGAVLGDWLSFWLGRRYCDAVWGLWPLSHHPELREKSAAFLARWGALGVFASKFWGPLRASIPLAAGLGNLPLLPFQLANFASAAAWAFLLLAPAAFGLDSLLRWMK